MKTRCKKQHFVTIKQQLKRITEKAQTHIIRIALFTSDKCRKYQLTIFSICYRLKIEIQKLDISIERETV